MNFKKTLLVFCLITCVLFSVSSVVAGDVNDEVIASESQDSAVVSQATLEIDNDNQKIENNLISSSNEDILSEKDNGTFTALQDKISNATEGATIALENDYVNDGVLADGIQISKAVTINGNGYTIDAQHKSRIFNIAANNVILNNLTFINGNATSGGAICNSGNLTVTNCIFTQNSAELGGAIFSKGNDVTIRDSIFKNNAANYGGANYFDGTLKNLILTGEFTNNVAQVSGGANYFKGSASNVLIDGNFSDNVVVNGSGSANYFFKAVSDVTLIGNFNRNVANSNCNGSDKTGSGGANCFNKTVNNVVIWGNFTNNTGYRGGANLFYGAASNVSIMGNYNNNTGLLFGGANYFMNTLSDSSIVGDYSNNKATNWGGANYFNKFVSNVVISGDYIENSAAGGSALFFDRKMENVTISGNQIDNKGKNAIYMSYRIDSTLTVEDMEFVYNKVGSTEVSFKDATGITASVIDQSGAVVKVNNNTISVSGLAAGTYILSVKTVTDEEHDSVTEEAKITVKKATPKLTAKAKTFKKSLKTKKYSVTLKTNLNKALKNVKLTIKVNKKTYTAKTNKNGVATFKITKLTKKGTFKATITYKGDANYNKVTKNINIKCK